MNRGSQWVAYKAFNTTWVVQKESKIITKHKMVCGERARARTECEQGDKLKPV